MATRTASLRELNQRSGQIIAAVVETGDEVVVTDRGRPVARIIREEAPLDPWERLLRHGALRQATRPFRAPTRQRLHSGRSSREILDELRSDR